MASIIITDMNSISKFSLSLVLLITLAFAPALAQSENIGNIPEGRYLVIGTFHIKRNAVGFTNYVKKKNQFNVRLDYYPPEKYYYVYIKSYPPGEDGLKAVSLMRKETEFIDTWFMEVEPYANSGKNKPFVAEKKDNSGGSPGWVAVSTKKKTKNDELPHIVETNSYTHVVGIDGQVIGMVGNDGNVRGVNGRVIGTISGNGNVRGASGQDIGVIGADNQIIGAYGQVVGTLATNKSMIGALGTYAKVIDDKGNILGAVEANGKVRGLDGEIIGTLGSKGKVIGTDGEEIGVVGTYGQAISTEGKVIGTMNSDGKVIGAGGKVIGTRGANGKVIGLNGQEIGTIGSYGKVLDSAGKVIGAVDSEGQVLDSDGQLLGTVGAYGQVVDAEGVVIGAVGAYGQVIGNDGKIIGIAQADRSVVGLDGKVIGTVGADGKVRDATGKVIGAVGAYGQVIGADGTVIGIVGANGKVIGADGKVIGAVDSDGKVKDDDGKVIGTVGDYGQVIGSDGKVIGIAGTDGMVRDNDGKLMGSVGAYGKVRGSDGKMVGAVGAYGQVIGNDGKVVGTVGAFGQALDMEGKVIGTVGAGLMPEAVRALLSNAPILGNSTPLIKTVPKTYVENGKYKLFFNTYYEKNFKEIKGGVEIINPKTLRLLRVSQSLELVRIPDPNNGEHSVQLIASIFGYKKVQHDIKLDEPFDEVNEEFFHFKGDTLVADFRLQRYETGDIATMYNVFFFKDAAIMKPNSQFELNSLVDMLKENDELKIKIHGHTNGTARGNIITLPEGSEQFFTLNQEVGEEFGSAKELSLQRAEVIKNYLVSFGIDGSRMEVIGWGGKQPIYDKMDKLAVKNVRVEIEILEN